MRNTLAPSASPFEALEQRALLTAPSVHYVSAVTSPTALFVTVSYHADQGLDMTTLGQGDLQVSSTGRPTLDANLFGTPTTLQNGDVQATYLFAAYGGGWNYTNTGTYVTTSPAGRVKDLQGQNLSNTSVASNWLWFTAPKATFSGSTMETNDWLVVINYTDDAAMDAGSLSNGDINVVAPGVVTGITLQQVITNSPTNVTAIYKIPARDGAWNYTHGGNYLISTNNNEIADAAGTRMPSITIGSFWLAFDRPAAQIQPTTVRGNDWLIPIKYSALSPATIDSSSIGTSDITVTAPNGYSQTATRGTITNTGNGSYTVVYRVTARGGSWDFSDNSTYSVSVAGNAIEDTSHRTVPAATLQRFNLWFNNPSAEMVTPTSPTSTQWDIAVKFNDNGTLDTSSITSQSIRVVVPGGGSTSLSLIGVTSGPGSSKIATFRLTPTSGVLPNGNYQVWVNPNQVHDTQNSFAYENLLASFYLFF